jgi:hypothetical protein
LYYKFVHGKIKCPNCGQKNLKGSLYCNLCYEPFNKPHGNKKKIEAQRAAPSAPKPVPAGPLLLKAGLITLAAALALLYTLNTSGTPKDGRRRAPAINRFSEKSGAADKLLADYLGAKETLLAEIAEGPPEPEGFGIAGQYTLKLFGIEEAYASAMEALELPPAAAVDKDKDGPYLEWLEIHRYREGRAMEDFSGKYQQLIVLSGAAR